MTRILFYQDGVVGEVVVLKAPQTLLENYGRRFEDWPNDLGVYDRLMRILLQN